MGFLVSAWTGFFVMIFHYMATPQESNNVLDISIHKTIQRVLRKTQLSHWASVSESVCTEYQIYTVIKACKIY